MDKLLFVFFQYIIPKHLLSRLVGMLARSEVSFIKNNFIKLFIKLYDINMKEACDENIDSYISFNEFFSRRLKAGSRIIDQGIKSVVSPVDGVISQIGLIKKGRIIQAKGKYFNLFQFLGGDKNLFDEFKSGLFATIYLSPKDYHRVHMPFEGKLRQMIYIPGQLFSVNPTTANSINNLFAKNERLVCIFDTVFGPMAVVLIGALIVSGIHVKWENKIINKKKIQKYIYPTFGKDQVKLNKGEELGKFMLGSTVVVCFPQNKITWLKNLSNNSFVKMGEIIGSF